MSADTHTQVVFHITNTTNRVCIGLAGSNFAPTSDNGEPSDPSQTSEPNETMMNTMMTMAMIMTMVMMMTMTMMTVMAMMMMTAIAITTHSDTIGRLLLASRPQALVC